MTAYLPHVTTSDGRKWSAEAVELLVAERDAICHQRDHARLERDLIQGGVRRLASGVVLPPGQTGDAQ